jgi:hypothetical protein
MIGTFAQRSRKKDVPGAKALYLVPVLAGGDLS